MFAEDSKNLFIDSSFYLISANCYYPDSGQPGGYERPYYIKTDTAGNIIWRLIYGKENGFHGFPFYQPLKSQSGYFYDIGWHSNQCDTPALIKFSATGEESYFQDLFPGACPGGNGALNFFNDTTLVVFVGGTVGGNLYSKWIKTDTLGIENQSVYYNQNWIIKTGLTIIDSDQKIVSLSRIEQTVYLYKLNSSLEFDSLYTMPRVYDSLCPYPIVSDTIDPDCGLIVQVEEPEHNPEAFRLRVFPNPAKERLTINLPAYLQRQSGPAGFRASTVWHRWGAAELVAYNTAGRQVMSVRVNQDALAPEIDVSSWPAGLYLFRLMFRGDCVADAKVIIE